MAAEIKQRMVPVSQSGHQSTQGGHTITTSSSGHEESTSTKRRRLSGGQAIVEEQVLPGNINSQELLANIARELLANRYDEWMDMLSVFSSEDRLQFIEDIIKKGFKYMNKKVRKLVSSDSSD